MVLILCYDNHQMERFAQASPEKILLRERFSPEEKRILERDGAIFYLLTGQTIEQQRDARKKLGLPAFNVLVNLQGEKVLTVPSRRIEVAIYPDPKRFFVPGTFSQFTITQKRLVEEDGEALRKRLKLNNITEIIPDEASTVTELVFQHVDRTGEWLLGDLYSRYTPERGQFKVHVRTKNPTDQESWLAEVGTALPGWGLEVSRWHHYSARDNLGAFRLVVPR